jgi:hypothetical protein
MFVGSWSARTCEAIGTLLCAHYCGQMSWLAQTSSPSSKPCVAQWNGGTEQWNGLGLSTRWCPRPWLTAGVRPPLIITNGWTRWTRWRASETYASSPQAAGAVAARSCTMVLQSTTAGALYLCSLLARVRACDSFAGALCVAPRVSPESIY